MTWLYEYCVLSMTWLYRSHCVLSMTCSLSMIWLYWYCTVHDFAVLVFVMSISWLYRYYVLFMTWLCWYCVLSMTWLYWSHCALSMACVLFMIRLYWYCLVHELAVLVL